MGTRKTFDLRGKANTDDATMEKVLAAQARVRALQRTVAALRKDRDGLLSEFIDLQRARKVPKCPPVKSPVKSETIRVYAGDLHGMRMDRGCVTAFLFDMKHLAPDEIVLGGDMLECGGHLAKHQPIGYVALCDYTYQEDVLATNWFLDELQKAAPGARIYYMEGNHEHRVEAWCVDVAMSSQREAEHLRQVYGPETLLRLKDRGIPYFRQGEVYGEGFNRGWIKLGPMYVVHNPFGDGGGGQNAAAKAVGKTAGNITYFHTHSFDASPRVFPSMGLVMAFSPGCLCEMKPMWRHSDPSGWNQGYDIDFIAPTDRFQRVHVPIWRGESLATAMIERFKS